MKSFYFPVALDLALRGEYKSHIIVFVCVGVHGHAHVPHVI